jgi:hypothetical protein
MKKFGLIALMALAIAGFTACEKTTDSGNDTAGTSNAGTENVTTPDITPDIKATPEDMANPNGSVADMPKTTIEFDQDSHNFGKIRQGEVVAHTFKFTNTGENPLRVETVKPSCGCTSPNWTKEDIAPGKTGEIVVEFDSKGKNGMQNKSVTVVTNSEPQAKVLTFSGEVVTE